MPERNDNGVQKSMFITIITLELTPRKVSHLTHFCHSILDCVIATFAQKYRYVSISGMCAGATLY